VKNKRHGGTDIAFLRAKAEEELKQAKPEAGASPASSDPERLIHELQVYQVELEMQNEELRRAQTELQDSRSRYVDLYNLAPVGYLTFSEKGFIKEANLTAAGLLGVEGPALKNRPFLLFIDSSEYRDMFFRHIRHALMTGKKQTCELMLKREGDAPFPAQLESITAEVEGHAVIRTILTDITERRNAEKKLNLHAAALEGINEVLNAALSSETETHLGMACLRVAERITQSRFGFIAEIGSDGTLHDIAISNPGWDQCSIEGIGGHGCPRGNLKIHGILGRVLSEGAAFYTNDPTRHPDRIVLPDGHPPLESFLGVPLAMGGKTIGIVALGNRQGGYTDTEKDAVKAIAPAIAEAFLRKRAEEALKKSHAELEKRVDERTSDLNQSYRKLEAELQERRRLIAAMEQSAEAILIVEGETLDIQYTNPAFLRLSGYTFQELAGKNARILRSDWAEGSVYESLREKVTRGGIWVGNYPLRRKDGSVAVTECTISPVVDASARVVSRVATCHDTTEKRRLEEQLRQSQKLEAIGTLAGGIAHDFNNILAGIIGFTEMVLDDIPRDSPLHHRLDLVLKSGFRGRDLVRRILAFSRKTDYEREPLALSPLVRETVSFLRASLPATIAIKMELGKTPDMVIANSSEIQQIIMNLCTNATQAMKRTGGELSVSLNAVEIKPDTGSELPPGGYAEIAVKDTGTGIDEEVKKRMFEPFYTTKEVGEGTGLGLSVVYGIVKALKGDIKVESAPGIGSTFRVQLPLADTVEAAGDIESGQAPRGRERVLFIDDEEFLVELGKGLLERLGYKVTAMTDPNEALELFSGHPSKFDLVFTDMTMPGMSGLELARALLKKRPSVPIILCTGYNDEVSTEKAMAVGIRGFLMKPLSRSEITVAIRRVLDAEKKGMR